MVVFPSLNVMINNLTYQHLFGADYNIVLHHSICFKLSNVFKAKNESHEIEILHVLYLLGMAKALYKSYYLLGVARRSYKPYS